MLDLCKNLNSFFSRKLRACSLNQHCKDRVRGRSVWCQYFFIHGVAGSPYDNQRSSALAAMRRSTMPRTCKMICLTLRQRSNLPAQSAHIVALCAKHVLCREAREGGTSLQRYNACTLGLASDISMSNVPLLKLTKALTNGSLNPTT